MNKFQIIGIILILSGLAVGGHWYVVHYPQGQFMLELILPAIANIVIGIMVFRMKE